MHSIFSMHIWVHILYAIKLFKQWVCASTTNLPILGGWQFLCRILRPSILSFFFFVYRFIPFCDCCCCSYCLPRSVACPNTAFKYIYKPIIVIIVLNYSGRWGADLDLWRTKIHIWPDKHNHMQWHHSSIDWRRNS